MREIRSVLVPIDLECPQSVGVCVCCLPGQSYQYTAAGLTLVVLMVWYRW